MSPPLMLAVIGAGVSGLTAARALKSEGHKVIVYEKSNRLGGTWVYDPRVESDPLSLDPDREIVHGSMYPSLCTNLPWQLMGFSDYPFPHEDSDTDFPGHEKVLKFLNEFAMESGLIELIRFDTDVVRVERVGLGNDYGWVVESKTRLGSIIEEAFDAVVVCNGHYTQPRLASVQGIEIWPGKQIHSHNYRVPDIFQDEIVVVIGDGPSAVDITKEISQVAKEVHLSSRSPNVKVYKLEWANNMWQHSEIDYVDENGEVYFQDGPFVHADVIFHCTGFEYHFPFLKTDGIVALDDRRVGPLYKHIFPPKLAPSLSFIGLPYRAPIFLMVDLQAKWVAHVLSGKAYLSSEEEMMIDVEEYYRKMEFNGIPKRHTHRLDNEFEYLDWLAIQVGLASVDEQTKLMYGSYLKFIIQNGLWNTRDWKFDNGLQEGESRVESDTETL